MRLEVTLLLRLVLATKLSASMPSKALAMRVGSVLREVALLLRLVRTVGLRAAMPSYANIVNVGSVHLDIPRPVLEIFFLNNFLMPQISMTIFDTFPCKTFDGDYGSYLTADMSIECDGAIKGYATDMIFVFPVGRHADVRSLPATRRQGQVGPRPRQDGHT